MAAPLTIHNAQIATATVEIKTLTVSGKQVTLAVFRQLTEKPLIADDGTLNGSPWGIVNYHPDKCANAADHIHVVWQDGAELRRSAILVTPYFKDDDLYDGNPAFVPDGAARFYAASVYHWLTTGEPKYWTGGMFALFSGELKQRGGIAVNDPYSQRRWIDDAESDFTYVSKPAGVRVHVAIAPEATAAVLAEIRVRQESNNLANASGEHRGSRFCSCKACKQAVLTEAQEDLEAKLTALRDYAPGELDDMYAAHAEATAAEAARRKQYREAETERRDRHHAVRRTLTDLPQLFIAV